jgi:glycosyltransferase involved in cell wall biosynthesis
VSATPLAAKTELRVLIVAENASAVFGGEAALPLHYFRVLDRRGIPVWLVTHARTRAELSELYPGNDRIVYVEDSRWHRFLWQLGLRLPAMVSHLTTGFLSRLSTQLAQRRIARRLVRENGIGVVHQPMPVSPKEPSLLYGFGVPVVIGPMNGGMDYPPAFARQRGRVEQALLRLGRASASALNRIMPGKRRAAILLVANQRTRDALPGSVLTRNVLELVENGVDLGLWQDRSPGESRGTSAVVTFVFMGRLIPLKAVDLLLRAFAVASRAAPMRLLILGDGEQRSELDALAAELGLARDSSGRANTVEFAGWLPQSACVQRMSGADVLVMPSLHDCGGAVVLEAMALAKPVIATAWGGPLDYLDASCGMLVAPASAQAIMDGFAAAMIELASSADVRSAMGASAIARIRRDFDWERKVDRIVALYRDVIGAYADRGAAGKP